MMRAVCGVVAGFVVAGLAGCGNAPVPNGVQAPDQASFKTQFYGPLGGGCAPCGPVGPAAARSVVAQQTCAVPALVPTPVAFNRPVLTSTPVTHGVPITQLVPVTTIAPATTFIPTVANLTQIANVPTIAPVPASRSVVFSQFCSPWVPTAASPVLPGAAPIAPGPAALGGGCL